jgi:hypothetical protein
MIEGFLLLDAVGALVLVTLLVVRLRNAAVWRASLVCYELRFPRGLAAAQVTAFFNGLAGLSGSRWQRAVEPRAVVLELSATAEGIGHFLLIPQPQAPFVLATVRAALPGVTARLAEGYEPARPVVTAGLGLSQLRRPLAVDRCAEVGAAILAAVQPLGAGERVVVQWVVSPAGPVAPVRAGGAAPAGRSLGARLVDLAVGGRDELTGEDLKLARAKQSSAQFSATGRIGVVARHRGRARGLLAVVVGAHHAANAPGVHLRRRRLAARAVGAALRERRLPVAHYPAIVNAAELGMLVAFPVGEVMLPGLRLAGCRLLAPSREVPAAGRVLGRANFPGAERPVALSVADSLRHVHVIGPTGVGKSTLLTGLIAGDMAAGRGVVVVDPKGDLVGDVLDRVPPGRVGDVIVLDPADESRPVGLNLLAGSAESRELVADQVVGIFHSLYRAFWGPRLEDTLRSALLTLVGVPGMTLAEVPLLLTDPNFRRRLVGRLDDPIALGPFWGWYEGLSDGERAAAIGPVMNKLRAFLLRRRLRNVLGQASPRLDFDRVLAERKILLVPLAKGVLGEDSAALIGSLVVARLWQAVQARAALPAADRHPTFAYIDEAQDFLHLPTDIGDVLAQARGLGLGLTLAHQHLGQLPTELRAAIMANCRSRVMFQVAAADAGVLAREVAPHLTAADLQGLEAYETVMTLSAGSRVAPPTTARTELPPPTTGQAEAARAQSRRHYGRDRAEVEAALRARHEGRVPRVGVGRRAVSS